MVDTVSAANSINSLVKQADIAGLPSRIADALKTAATKTGVSFSYLMQKASQESGFDPNAKASSSSATGLFQFTNQTWLRTVKDHGAQYGLSNYANQIKVDANGVAHVSDPTMRQAILNLRKDPTVSAEMAGELDKENLSSLQSNVGGKIGATDLYMAHFLGAGGASDFLNAMKSSPNASAATVVPDAAAANPSVFYTSSGQPRSLKQIYNHFAQKFDSSSTMLADASSPLSNAAATNAAAVMASRFRATASPSYTVASASLPDVSSALTNSTAANSAAGQVMSSIKANTSSSLMATMIMAQMNMDESAANLQANSYGIQSQSKNSAINILGSLA